MKKDKIEIRYEVFENINELSSQDAWLLNEARGITNQAYAPYSNFYVGAAAKLKNGEIVTGTNQENASFPAGLLKGKGIDPAIPDGIQSWGRQG